MTKTTKKKNTIDIPLKSESKLIKIIQDDPKLDRDTRMSYLSMANLFLEKFEENLSKTSIEMDNEIPLGIDVWKDFLNYPPIRGYLQSFRDERIAKIADKGLMEGDKNAVNIKKVMDSKGPIINNSNIVLIRLPEKLEFE